MTTTLIRRAGVLALIATTTAGLSGCAGVIGAKMTYDDTEKGKITDIVLAGGGGDVTVTTAPVTETTIRRVVRQASNPGTPYQLQGTTLTLDTICGMHCSVSYEIKTPPGVKVHGRLGSGDIRLDSVADTDLELTSGDLTVTNATGPVQVRATSGDIHVNDAKSSVKVQSTSGDIEALNAAGPVDVRVTSGDVQVSLAAPNSVTAHATSGDVTVNVPGDGKYKLVTSHGSGDLSIQGLENDSSAKNVIDVRTGSGDVNVTSVS
ncbi:DUF4097 family beta strand repeat-containing protein [Actinoplanes subtropicus]|uniref:DUF4097 family beta strand repeat-containing protein n=1 Tax=Actinoplanes subtropicus TaxID=543632 RepID=UPI0004C2B5E5|nr:DUF4097 family beta strand repeat-containing protein [Actinoplanes subtropicus]